MENKKRGLLDLPAEIWSDIGKLVIANEPELTAQKIFTFYRTAPFSEFHAFHPAITRTCGVLREEVLPVYYKTRVEVRLLDECFNYAMRLLGRWLRAIGASNRCHICVKARARQNHYKHMVQEADLVWLVPYEVDLVLRPEEVEMGWRDYVFTFPARAEIEEVLSSTKLRQETNCRENHRRGFGVCG